MEKYFAKLKNAGAKITHPRIKVLEILLSVKQPMSVTEIFKATNGVDFASIFRTIQLYLSLNIVREIKMCDKQVRYELTTDQPHHHILCSKCGKIENIDMCIIDDIKKLTNYQITDHIMEFTGICPECRTQN